MAIELTVNGRAVQISAPSVTPLLDLNPSPTRAEIARALDQNLCRCGAHPRILRAVEKAAAMLREGNGA